MTRTPFLSRQFVALTFAMLSIPAALAASHILLGTRSPLGHAKTKCPCAIVLTSANTPIKGAGGSATFHSINPWMKLLPLTLPETWCTKIPSQAQYWIAFNKNNPVRFPVTGAWTVFVYTYAADPNTRGRDGVVLTARPGQGCSGETNISSVTLTSLDDTTSHTGTSGFYTQDGPQSNGWGHNRRFRNDRTYSGASGYDCKQDRDLCERIGYISVDNNVSFIRCDDADCSVRIQLK